MLQHRVQWRHMSVMASQIADNSISWSISLTWNKTPKLRIVMGVHQWHVSLTNQATLMRKNFPCHDLPTTFSSALSFKISLKFVPKLRINNIPTLVRIMAWRQPGGKPLSGPMMVSLQTHICVTQTHRVKGPHRNHCINSMNKFCYTRISRIPTNAKYMQNDIRRAFPNNEIYSNAQNVPQHLYEISLLQISICFKIRCRNKHI